MIAKAALVASSLFGDLVRDGLRFAGAVVLYTAIGFIAFLALKRVAGGSGGGGDLPYSPPDPEGGVAT